MKHLFTPLAAIAAVFTLTSTTAIAADTDIAIGVEGGIGQWTFIDREYPDEQQADTSQLTGTASVMVNFTPSLGIQGDLVIRRSDREIEYGTLKTQSITGAVHGFYREPEKFLLGGLVQLGQEKPTYDNYAVEPINRAAVEGQVFLDQVTLYGQAGIDKISSEFGDGDGWFASAELRYLVTENLKLFARGTYGELTLKSKDESEVKTMNFGLGAEYKLADLPLSIIGGYDYALHEVNGGSAEIGTHRLTVGLKFSMGQETLQGRDRNGASLGPVDYYSPSNFLTGFGVK
jgi:hypothetical protein